MPIPASFWGASRFCTLCLLSLFLVVAADPDFAADLSRWFQSYPNPTSQNLWDAACDGTNWVAVGSAGTILVSPNGTNWSPAISGVARTRALKAVAYGDGCWVAVGEAGSLVTSDDAARWTNRMAGTSAALAAVTFGNNRFVAVGSGATAYSPNGTNWTVSGTGASLLCLAYGNGIFVAGGLGVLQTSPDGIAWAAQSASDIFSVWFDGNQFLAGDRNGQVSSSPDGTNWTLLGSPSSSSIRKFTKVGNDWFAASGYFWRSSDLLNWTYQETGAYSSSSGGGVYGATLYGEKLIVLGEAGNILLSTDTTNFFQCRKDQILPLSALVAIGTRVIAFSQSDPIMITDDGSTWTQRSSGAAGFIANQAIADENGIVVAGSYFQSPGFGANEIRRSADGIAWSGSHLPSSGGLFGVVHAGGLYVAVGSSGVIHTSTNGTSWTSNAISGKPSLFGVASGAGLFVAVGPGGTNYSSTDGNSWTPANSQTTRALRSIAYGAGRFVAVGASGAAVWSDDGSTWHAASSGTSANFSSVLFADTQFLAVGLGSTFSSPDGSSWSVVTNAPSNLTAIAFAGGAFYATSVANKAVFVSGIPSLRLGIRTAASSGQIYIDTFSRADETVWLESSSNLVSWAPRFLLTNKLGFGSIGLPFDQTAGFFRLSRTVTGP